MYQIKEKLKNGHTVLLTIVDNEEEAVRRVSAAKSTGRDVWYCKE